MLFYAQPVSRIALLTTNDVLLDEDATVLLRIGDPPTPVPEPLASLLRELLTQRGSFQGPNADTAWLFPGRRAGQPMRLQALGALLRQYGIAVQAGRTSALRPPPSANSRCRPQPQSSQACSATTTRTPHGSAPKPAAPGVATHPVTITNRDDPLRQDEELRSVDYESSPASQVIARCRAPGVERSAN